VIEERRPRAVDGVVGVVVRYVDHRVEERVCADRGGGQKPVEARRPRVGRGGVFWVDVKEGVRVVLDIHDAKVHLELPPSFQKIGRGEGGVLSGGVGGLFDEIKVTANKSGTDAPKLRRDLTIRVFSFQECPPEIK